MHNLENYFPYIKKGLQLQTFFYYIKFYYLKSLSSS